MKQEITVTGKTVEAAVAAGAEQLGVDVSSVTYDIVEAPKKGFLGFGETLAKVKVMYVPSPETVGLLFVRTLIADMGLEAEAALSAVPGSKREFLITVSGPDASVLIGHHGETLDSLQYLANLAANRREDDEESNYTRISMDVENYRAKREETLRRLAIRMANKVQKYKRNVTLEPMNAYERRIIHATVQSIEGVTTHSVGSDNNRRVVISAEAESRPAPKTPKTPPRTAASRIVPKNKIQKRARFDESLPEYQPGSSYSEDAAMDAVEAESDTDEI